VARRVSIQGISGSGKTTLGRALAERLGVPYVETDALVHGPGWSETPDAELRALLEPVVAGDGWVIDNDYRRKIGTYVLEHADMIVWLDLPLHVCLGRLWRRTSGRIRTGEELWNGNRESWRGAFWGRESLFVWAIRKYVEQRRSVPELLGRPELSHLQVVRLRTPAAAAAWLRLTVDGAADDGAQRG
jgi:adenylate kinase family enzyme